MVLRLFLKLCVHVYRMDWAKNGAFHAPGTLRTEQRNDFPIASRNSLLSRFLRYGSENLTGALRQTNPAFQGSFTGGGVYRDFHGGFTRGDWRTPTGISNRLRWKNRRRGKRRNRNIAEDQWRFFPP